SAATRTAPWLVVIWPLVRLDGWSPSLYRAAKVARAKPTGAMGSGPDVLAYDRDGPRAVGGEREADAPPGFRAVIIDIELNRAWPCSGCGQAMRKGQRVRVHIAPGQPHNRVFHPQCGPPD